VQPPPFTPKMVRALLRAAARGGFRTPDEASPAVGQLTGMLNWLSGDVQNVNRPRRELGAIDQALGVLASVLPKHLATYQPDDPRTKELRALLDAVVAAHRARVCGLPFAPGPSRDEWAESVTTLQDIFRTALPAAPDAVGFRFLAAAIPMITREKPTAGAVKAEIMRRRPPRDLK
jgi:hypothetical protein